MIDQLATIGLAVIGIIGVLFLGAIVLGVIRNIIDAMYEWTWKDTKAVLSGFVPLLYAMLASTVILPLLPL